MFKSYAVSASGRDVHFDTLLSNVAVAAFDSMGDGFVANQIAPLIPVLKQSDLFLKVDKSSFLRSHDARRAPKAKARVIEWSVSSEAFFCHNFALATETALEDLDNADMAFQLRENNTNLLVGELKRGQEIRVRNLVTSISNIGSGVVLTGTNKWSDFVSSDPIGDVSSGINFMREQTGLRPNLGVLDYRTFDILRRHPAILDLYKYTTGSTATAEQIAAAFALPRVAIADGMLESGIEGGASSIADIWPKCCLLFHVGPVLTRTAQAPVARFQWQPPSFPAALAAHTKVFAGAGERNVEVTQAEHFQDERMIAPELAYALLDVID